MRVRNCANQLKQAIFIYAFNVRSYTLQNYWESTTGKVQGSPQENFKAERVGVVVPTSIILVATCLLKEGGEGGHYAERAWGAQWNPRLLHKNIIMIIPSCPIFFKNHLLQVEKNTSNNTTVYFVRVVCMQNNSTKV